MRFVFNDDNSRIVMHEPDVVEAVKGVGYRVVATKTNRRNGGPK